MTVFTMNMYFYDHHPDKHTENFQDPHVFSTQSLPSFPTSHPYPHFKDKFCLIFNFAYEITYVPSSQHLIRFIHTEGSCSCFHCWVFHCVADTIYHSTADGHLDCFQFFFGGGTSKVYWVGAIGFIAHSKSSRSNTPLCMTDRRQDMGAVFATQGRRRLPSTGGWLLPIFDYDFSTCLLMVSWIFILLRICKGSWIQGLMFFSILENPQLHLFCLISFFLFLGH